VVVLDRELRWGGVDGVLAWLQERATSGAALIPTASADHSLEVIESPEIGFLLKPLTLTVLSGMVRSAVAKRREAAQKVGQYLLIRSFFSDDAELFPTTQDVAE